jgi:NodT family efflux transporter outer membrane factor (OMF) lipoprotein
MIMKPLMRRFSNATPSNSSFSHLALPVLAALLMAGCTVGPKYHAPAPVAPPEYKEAKAAPTIPSPAAGSPDPTLQGLGAWQVAAPSDATLRGNWWELYNEPELNALEAQLDINNQNIQQAYENFMAARATVRQARAAFFPTATIGAGGSRNRTSSNVAGSTGSTYTSLDLTSGISWEPDLWGKVRNSVRQAQANAQVSAATLVNARLSAQASLAEYYFELRGQDALRQILTEAVQADQKSLDYNRAQYETGIGMELTVAQAQSTVEAAQSTLINLGVARTQYEHAIAMLIGKPPAEFSLAERPMLITPPSIPIGMPSQLLERRPDVASAERTLAAANAQIGIGKAAYYPTVTLSATGGLDSSSWKHLIDWPSRVWSIGPSATETVFDAGLRRAQVQQYEATYRADLAAYRQTVLTAFQQVEDALSSLRILSEQVQQQQRAVQASRRALDLELIRYQEGLDPYINVVTEQNLLLSAQETMAQIEVQRAVASVQLIQALGGGWQRGQLPTDKQVTQKPSADAKPADATAQPAPVAESKPVADTAKP